MSDFSDSCRSNMNSDSISIGYNTLGSRKLTPTAPPMGHGGSPLLLPSSSSSSSSAEDGSRLYPELRSDRGPLSRQDSSVCTSITLQDFVYVRDMNLPVTDNYASEVFRVGELSYSDEKVMGMVFIAPFLYAIHRNSNILYKSDTTYANHRGFITPPMSSHSISGLMYPRGMAANLRTKHFYITDRHTSKGLLLKVTMAGVVAAHGDLPGVEPFGVSVAPSNESVIVACCRNPCGGVVRMSIASAGFVAIFEDTGDHLREQQRILLQESIQVPRHVLEAPRSGSGGRGGKEYLVVHGWIQIPGIECDHQVSRVNGDGRIVRSFGAGHGKTERHLNRPMSISFDDCDKMFVADSFNDRILLLNGVPSESYDLELVRPLVTKANGLSRPRHVCLDSKKRLLYVGKASGHVDVFYVGRDSEEASQPSQTTEKKS